jgi:hypothetical protein
MAGLVQDVEQSSEVGLGPAIVVALHDADTVSEGKRRSDQETVAHLGETSVDVNESNHGQMSAMGQRWEKKESSVCFLRPLTTGWRDVYTRTVGTTMFNPHQGFCSATAYKHGRKQQ